MEATDEDFPFDKVEKCVLLGKKNDFSFCCMNYRPYRTTISVQTMAS